PPGAGSIICARLGDGLTTAAAESGSIDEAARARAQRTRRMRAMLSIGPESRAHAAPVPVQVAGEPFPEPEPAFARGAVTPGGRYLGHRHPERVSLDRELQAELETACGFDRHP